MNYNQINNNTMKVIREKINNDLKWWKPQQENIKPQRNIEINDKLPDEGYQKNKIDDKESDEKLDQ